MEVMGHIFGALGHMLLWVSTLLMLEELTLGGLARLLLTRLSGERGKRKRKTKARG